MTITRNLAALLAITLMGLASGCVTVHDSHLDGRLAAKQAQCPDLCIIFVESIIDIGQWGKLPEIADYFACCGVNSVYFDPCVEGCTAQDLADRIRYEKCRNRRVMVVGWSASVLVCLDALEILADDGVCIDTFFVMDMPGINVWKGSDPQPSNVRRVVWCKSTCSPEPRGFDCLVLHEVDTCNHLQVPGHPTTINALFCEAIRLCGCRMRAPAPHVFESETTETDAPPPF
jgi:hypothetical protein